MIDWILKRRSLRSYTAEPVSAEQIEMLLKAAMAAPTANNIQDWEFVVVTDAAARKAIAEALPHGRMAEQAPLVIVVLGDPQQKYMEQDCAAATQNILLAASSLDLGSVWLGMKDPERIAGVRRALAIPETRVPVVTIAIGHPAESKPPRTQYDPAKIHVNAYGRRS
jgi:nitroreductase